MCRSFSRPFLYGKHHVVWTFSCPDRPLLLFFADVSSSHIIFLSNYEAERMPKLLPLGSVTSLFNHCYLVHCRPFWPCFQAYAALTRAISIHSKCPSQNRARMSIYQTQKTSNMECHGMCLKGEPNDKFIECKFSHVFSFLVWIDIYICI